MNRLRWLGLLMLVTIFGITAFQLYWLKENYAREEKTLSIKSGVTFRETIMRLQGMKLRISDITSDSLKNGDVRIFVDDKGRQIKFKTAPREQIISTINVIRDQLDDSLKKLPGGKASMTITMKEGSESFSTDSIHFHRQILDPRGDRIMNLLYGVDSLQDSIRLNEVNTAYIAALKEQQLDIPFTILKLDSGTISDRPSFDEVRVGFTKPVIYKLQLGNTFPYLIRKIYQPILFSILLLGITVLSFVLLYRNLLRQRRLAELKNEFISNITHELKTPIATVGVAIEALKNFNAIHNPERTKEYLDISSNELQRLNLLVDKVLKLSMFEKKELELKKEYVNAESVVSEVVDSLRLQLEKYHATVSVTHEGDTGLQADRLHLLSVVFNLLDNAVKYSKENPVIKIDIRGNDTSVILSVTDNGIGIAPEYKDKIFEKFFRIPHGDTHNARGYGLGLSYVVQVIQKHHGTISVESQPGSGTAFIITLPKQS